MLYSTKAINPMLQNISTDTLLMLQNTLDMQQFQRFQEAPALGSSFTCMLEKRPRFLNAWPHAQGKSKSCSTHSLAPGLVEQIWKTQQPVFTCHLFHDLATSLPIPPGILRMCYVCRWLSCAQMEVTQFPSNGLQEEWQGEGHQNSSRPLLPLSMKETEHRLPNSPGSSSKLPPATFPHTEETRSHAYMHSFCTHATKSKVSQTIRFTVHIQISYTVQNQMAWSSSKRKQQCCGVQAPQSCGSTVPSQKASVLFTVLLLKTTLLHSASGCRYLQKTFRKIF